MNIKHIILITSMLPAALNAFYIPTAGPLTLYDQRPYAQYAGTLPIIRGVVMETLLTDPNFKTELHNIISFLGIPTATMTLNNINMPQRSMNIDVTYQELMDKLASSTNTYTLKVVDALEKALMHQYHYQEYILGSYNQYGSLFITGVHHPKHWLCNPNPIFDQIMQELENLANITTKHSWFTANRIRMMIHSYKTWKKSASISAVTGAAILILFASSHNTK